MREKIIEVPISYNGREYKEGKKIKAFDAIRALIVINCFFFLSKVKKPDLSSFASTLYLY